MRRLVEFLILCAATALASGGARAAEAPTTADVLSMLHQANEREVDMGRMAAEHGNTKEVRDFGKTLVRDHLAAEKKVVKLAKDEKIELAETTAESDMDTLPSGAALDEAFTRFIAAHASPIPFGDKPVPACTLSRWQSTTAAVVVPPRQLDSNEIATPIYSLTS